MAWHTHALFSFCHDFLSHETDISAIIPESVIMFVYISI